MGGRVLNFQVGVCIPILHNPLPVLFPCKLGRAQSTKEKALFRKFSLLYFDFEDSFVSRLVNRRILNTRFHLPSISVTVLLMFDPFNAKTNVSLRIYH